LKKKKKKFNKKKTNKHKLIRKFSKILENKYINLERIDASFEENNLKIIQDK